MQDPSEDKLVELTQTANQAGRPVIIIFEDADGNWRGLLQKAGKTIQVRDVGPETVLQLLLTHDGK